MIDSNLRQRIGARLTEARLVTGLPLRRVALRVGISITTLQQYENATRPQRAEDLAALATVLGVPVASFFDEPPGVEAEPPLPRPLPAQGERSTSAGPIASQIGSRLRKAREAARQDLAELALDLGIPSETLELYEAGQLAQPAEHLVILAKALGTKVSQLLGERGARGESDRGGQSDLDTERKRIGARLLAARLSTGRTLADVAGRVNLALATLSAYERGAVSQKADYLVVLAGELGVSVSSFFDDAPVARAWSEPPPAIGQATDPRSFNLAELVQRLPPAEQAKIAGLLIEAAGPSVFASLISAVGRGNQKRIRELTIDLYRRNTQPKRSRSKVRPRGGA